MSEKNGIYIASVALICKPLSNRDGHIFSIDSGMFTTYLKIIRVRNITELETLSTDLQQIRMYATSVTEKGLESFKTNIAFPNILYIWTSSEMIFLLGNFKLVSGTVTHTGFGM